MAQGRHLGGVQHRPLEAIGAGAGPTGTGHRRLPTDGGIQGGGGLPPPPLERGGWGWSEATPASPPPVKVFSIFPLSCKNKNGPPRIAYRWGRGKGGKRRGPVPRGSRARLSTLPEGGRKATPKRRERFLIYVMSFFGGEHWCSRGVVQAALREGAVGEVWPTPRPKGRVFEVLTDPLMRSTETYK